MLFVVVGEASLQGHEGEVFVAAAIDPLVTDSLTLLAALLWLHATHPELRDNALDLVASAATFVPWTLAALACSVGVGADLRSRRSGDTISSTEGSP